jgi:hypothetical protein
MHGSLSMGSMQGSKQYATLAAVRSKVLAASRLPHVAAKAAYCLLLLNMTAYGLYNDAARPVLLRLGAGNV